MRREVDRHNGDFHEYADCFPGGRGHESNRPHPSGGSGRGRGGGIAQLPPSNLPPREFHDGPKHAFSQIIPTATDTWDTQSGGQQRGTGHHHRRTRLDMDSRLTRGALARAYGDVGGRYGFCHPPDDGHYFQQQRETTGEILIMVFPRLGPTPFSLSLIHI